MNHRSTDPVDSDFTEDRARWRDASLFAKRNWLGAVVLVLSMLSALVTILLVSRQTEALQAQCERGNETRTTQLHVWDHVSNGNEKRADAWKSIGEQLPGSFQQFIKDQIDANNGEKVYLRKQIRNVANAQEGVSEHPDTKNPFKKAIVACDATFTIWGD